MVVAGLASALNRRRAPEIRVIWRTESPVSDGKMQADELGAGMLGKTFKSCLLGGVVALLAGACGDSDKGPSDLMELSSDLGTLDLQFGDGLTEDMVGREDGREEIPNRPPLFDPLPGITVKMGGSVEVDLSGYYADPEQKDEELVLSWSAQHVAAQELGAGRLLLVGPVDWSGVDLVAITVTDGGGLSDTEQMAVTVEKVDAPDPEDVVDDVADVPDVIEDLGTDIGEDTQVVCGAVHFEYQAVAGVGSVKIAGSFNGWGNGQPMWEMTDADGDYLWTYDGQVDPGEYQYKFVVDGNWIADPANPTVVDDGYGGKNSVVNVPNCP